MAKGHIVLETKNLTVGYRQSQQARAVLEGINVQLKAGSLVCFMGQNGVGKSTLLRTMCGMQKALAGEVIVDGTALQHYTSRDIAKKISVVLTEKPASGNLTVYQLISMGRYPYLDWGVRFSAGDKAIIEKAVEQVGIYDILEQKLYTLSDGQLQKAMIARSLVQDGNIMILDEPTAHLDMNNRVEIIHLLRKLSLNTGKAILMATHEMDLVLQVADRIWLATQYSEIVEGIPEDMVLNDTLDTIFKLKGYDLKTGKIKQNELHKANICLSGEGHGYLWTKNALERNGYPVVTDEGISIQVHFEEGRYYWLYNNQHFSNLESLLTKLNGFSY